MRLDKYLAETAQCTRSEAKALLAKGRVQVNGAVCKKGDTQLKETDTVAVDGKALNYRQFVYLMLNKPEGVVSASTDKRDTTVVDLVGDAYPRRELFPAGRLDKTSTGFVLLTDTQNGVFRGTSNFCKELICHIDVIPAIKEKHRRPGVTSSREGVLRSGLWKKAVNKSIYRVYAPAVPKRASGATIFSLWHAG